MERQLRRDLMDLAYLSAGSTPRSWQTKLTLPNLMEWGANVPRFWGVQVLTRSAGNSTGPLLEIIARVFFRRPLNLNLRLFEHMAGVFCGSCGKGSEMIESKDKNSLGFASPPTYRSTLLQESISHTAVVPGSDLVSRAQMASPR